jgi:hypothetical protein
MVGCSSAVSNLTTTHCVGDVVVFSPGLAFLYFIVAVVGLTIWYVIIQEEISKRRRKVKA